MGEVYRARDTRLQRDVAIKFLPARYTQDARRLRRFEQEAFATSALNHPNIVTLYDIGADGDTPYFVTELLEGASLRTHLETSRLPVRTVLDYARQIADGLAAAHAKCIVHRDLKPENVFVTHEGLVKILDFGLAKLKAELTTAAADGDTVTWQTEPGVVMGTVGYMSPEQVRGETADERSDIFAFGAILYEMLSRRRAFHAGTRAETMAAIVSGEPPDLDTTAGSATPALSRLVRRCLEKHAERRFHSAHDLGFALDELSTPTGTTYAPTAASVGWLAGRRVRARGGEVGESHPPPNAIGPAAMEWGSLPHARLKPLLWVTGVAAVILALLVVSRLSRSGEQVSRAMGNRLVVNHPGGTGGASFSPDGTMIAFHAGSPGIAAEIDREVFQLFVKNLAQGDPVQITRDVNDAALPRWSPKGDQILFHHRGGIWSIPPLGGQARLVIERGRDPYLSPDGAQFVFEVRSGPDQEHGIWMADEQGNNRRLVIARAYRGLAFPALAPDGQSIVYLDSEPFGETFGDLWTVPASGGTPRRITFDNTQWGRPVWTPNGRFIIVPSARSGSQTLWKIPATGGVPEPLTSGSGQDRDPAISVDGRQLIYTNMRVSWALMIFDPITGERTQVLERRSPVGMVSFSHTGDEIAFFEESDAGAHLYVASLSGRLARRITNTAGERNVAPHWSADDALLYFTQSHPAASLRRARSAGGASVEVAGVTVQSQARVDPTGRSMVYVRLDDGRPSATIIRDLQSGQERALDVRIEGPHWSPDGQTVVGTEVLRDSEETMWNIVLCRLSGGPCRAVTTGYTPRLSADGARIYFLRPDRPFFHYLWSVRTDGQEEQKIAIIGPLDRDIGFDVSRQGQIVFVERRESKAELWRVDLR